MEICTESVKNKSCGNELLLYKNLHFYSALKKYTIAPNPEVCDATEAPSWHFSPAPKNKQPVLVSGKAATFVSEEWQQ